LHFYLTIRPERYQLDAAAGGFIPAVYAHTGSLAQKQTRNRLRGCRHLAETVRAYRVSRDPGERQGRSA